MIAAILLLSSLLYLREDSSKAGSQNPSPMVETVRFHQRIADRQFRGEHFTVTGLLRRPIEVFVPHKDHRADRFDLLIHFHGAAYVTNHAAEKKAGHLIAVTVNLGAGSGVYFDQFSDSTLFNRVLKAVEDSTEQRLRRKIHLDKINLSGFSAGYGAIKRILSCESGYQKVDAVLLLDGLHASYVPERKVLFEGGHIDSVALSPFVRFARDAAGGKSRKQFLFTHSEIFPGTFVSTTEAAEYLVAALGLKKRAVLRWGPLGMQQISEARKHRFAVLGFAGNSAPDHVDHLHALPHFLNALVKE
jgi:hypothetical protein